MSKQGTLRKIKSTIYAQLDNTIKFIEDYKDEQEIKPYYQQLHNIRDELRKQTTQEYIKPLQ